jgi:hypothetical protein
MYNKKHVNINSKGENVMENYNIRLATESDCMELSKLKHKIWNTTYRGIYPDEKIDNFDYEKNKNTFMKKWVEK